MKITGYIIVKIRIEAPDGSDPVLALSDVASEMDYSMTLDEDGLRIEDTEILEVSEDYPG